MKKKVTRCLALVLMLVALSLCFAGCDLNFGGNSGGGSTGDGNSSTTPTVEALSIVGNIKTEYFENEELDLNNAKLKVLYSDDTEKEISLLSTMVTNFSTTTIGNFEMKITYKQKSITKNYTVKFNPYGNYVLDENSSIIIYDYDGTEKTTTASYDKVIQYYNTTLKINNDSIVWYIDFITNGFTMTTTFEYSFDGAEFTATGEGQRKSTNSTDTKTETIVFSNGYYATLTINDKKIELKENFLDESQKLDYRIWTFRKSM